MKKLIVLIIVFVVIMVLLKIIATKVHPNSESKENIESNEWKVVNIVSLRGNSPKEVIGANLPKSAQDVHIKFVVDINTKIKSVLMVAKLPKADFNTLTEKLELMEKPDLLTIWPEAFDCEDKDLKEFWNITKSVDENTYYGEDPQIESRIMLKYETGTLYIKRSIYYDVKIGQDNQVYFKVRRR